MASLDPTAAIAELLAGNARFIAGQPAHAIQTAAERQELAGGQHPFAVVFGCSDSRVAPERLFDRRQGELFVIRTAGQALDEAVLGSIEYAVEHLQVPLVMVLGHGGCGAVAAALGELPPAGHLRTLVAAVRARIDAAPAEPGDPPENDAVRTNIRQAVQELLARSPVLAGHAAEGKLEIHGACYDLASGAVEMLPR